MSVQQSLVRRDDIFAGSQQRRDVCASRFDAANNMNGHLNVRIGNDGLRVIADRDFPQVHIALLSNVLNHNAAQLKCCAGPLFQQFRG